ncbi:hypothetical protein CNQ49_19950 [Escherichia coli]|nr:hypothetical protein CNQ49_19950 [Escherichia coli]
MTSLKTSIKTITYLSDIGCLEIQGASLVFSKKSKNMIYQLCPSIEINRCIFKKAWTFCRSRLFIGTSRIVLY